LPEALACVLALVLCARAGDPSFDHQNTTYTTQFSPIAPPTTGIYAMPYFSPDHSIATETWLVGNATKSVDISNPGWDMWLDCDSSSSCAGCTPTETRSDTFPLFSALLNALHRGVVVRVMTNDYDEPDCSGKISALPFLVLNGADVRYYTTTTFDHQKYINVDGKTFTISSINFSQTSYTQNREAGVVFSGETTTIAAFTSAVFDFDFAQAIPLKVAQKYSSADMKIITNKATIPVVIPPPPVIKDAYVTPEPKPIKLSSSDSLRMYTGPDDARSQVLDDITGATTSFQIMIYQVTDPELCESIYTMHKSGIDVTLLVSQCIDSTSDLDLAEQCYKNLTNSGFTEIYKTPSYYLMSHQKFWIIDGKRVTWSTGNWSPEDYATGSSFPPYGHKGWQETNRDFSASIEDASVVAVFQAVLTNDKSHGTTWASDPKISCSF